MKKKKLTPRKFLIFPEMERSSIKLEKLLTIHEGTYKVPKTNKKSASKKFLVSCAAFVIFTAVKHREIPCN